MVESAIWDSPNTRLWGEGRLLTAGSPRIDGRNAALPRASTSNRRGPDPPQRDTVLAAVKAWPAEPGVCAFDGATASL